MNTFPKIGSEDARDRTARYSTQERMQVLKRASCTRQAHVQSDEASLRVPRGSAQRKRNRTSSHILEYLTAFKNDGCDICTDARHIEDEHGERGVNHDVHICSKSVDNNRNERNLDSNAAIIMIIIIILRLLIMELEGNQRPAS